MTEKRYVARVGATTVDVEENGKRRALDPRLDLLRSSPTGFSWGYRGDGPSQLALAILADALDDDARALRLYQKYKVHRIARFPQDAALVIYASSARLDAALLENTDSRAPAPRDAAFTKR